MCREGSEEAKIPMTYLLLPIIKFTVHAILNCACDASPVESLRLVKAQLSVVTFVVLRLYQ